jgi:hypothetical protein
MPESEEKYSHPLDEGLRKLTEQNDASEPLQTEPIYIAKSAYLPEVQANRIRMKVFTFIGGAALLTKVTRTAFNKLRRP